MTQKLLDIAGIGRERLHFAWVSSAEAQRFVQIATEVNDSIKSLGRFDSEMFDMQLSAAERTLEGETLRWLVGKEVKITTKGDVYGRKWEVKKYESVLYDMLEREYHKNLIYLAIKQDCTNVRQISKKTGVDVLRISYLLADMERTSMVAFTGMEDSKPVFAAL
ncbi:conserved hypothetical protein [uncultured Desulfobacterium sp.]|uniref:F420-non-reducing hydrogenase iron-sulfur subunit D domain-containing protein n=1 Tax=uncultured Desulfobacterium sp. TaxID=201089 RepID=A0A445N1Y5_9BACT|nr:conserved hypothetical protein [uncultured Desulfobacterium sp.]